MFELVISNAPSKDLRLQPTGLSISFYIKPLILLIISSIF